MNKYDIMNELLGYAGIDNTPYRCTSCNYQLERIVVKEFTTQKPRKLFFCKRKKCSKFGLVTVVAKKP